MAELTAAQQASIAKGAEVAPEQDAGATDPGLTAATAFLDEYKCKTITLPFSGHVIEIQRLGPGEYLSVYGSALQPMMTAAGLDYNNSKARKKYEKTLTPNQRSAIVESNLQNFRRIAVKAITSIPFSMSPQHLCDNGVVSIYQISDSELLYICNEVDALSGWTADAEEFPEAVADAKDGAGKA